MWNSRYEEEEKMRKVKERKKVITFNVEYKLVKILKIDIFKTAG